MNNRSRTSNTIRNVIGGVVGQVFTSVLQFACRTVFISLLGATYLGVNGLFSNILSMLSLAELGIGPAIVFSMYKPIAENDEVHIAKLMNFYKQAYRIVAGVVLVVGLLLTPFLQWFINDSNGVENIRLIFILILFNTVTSYLYSYKGSMLNADQKAYVVTIIQNIFLVVQNVAQICILVVTHNFILYLCVQIITTFSGNLVLSKYVDRHYSFLVKYKSETIDKLERASILQKVKGMMMHKIGGFILNGTDNLVISKFVGIAMVGIYSNYLMIINMIKVYLTVITGSITASIGNLIATEEGDKRYSVYQVTLFIHFWLYGFCGSCFYILFSPFIKLWIGNDFLLDQTALLWIVMIFYLYGVHRANDAFTNASGVFLETRWKPIIESTINIVVSIYLAKWIGINGVFIGSVIAYFCTGWVEPMVLYRKVFHKNFWSYNLRFASYFVFTFSTLWFVNFIMMRMESTNLFVELFVRLIIIVISFNGCIVLTFSKTREFKMVTQYAKAILSRKRAK